MKKRDNLLIAVMVFFAVAISCQKDPTPSPPSISDFDPKTATMDDPVKITGRGFTISIN